MVISSKQVWSINAIIHFLLKWHSFKAFMFTICSWSLLFGKGFFDTILSFSFFFFLFTQSQLSSLNICQRVCFCVSTKHTPEYRRHANKWKLFILNNKKIRKKLHSCSFCLHRGCVAKGRRRLDETSSCELDGTEPVQLGGKCW